MKTAVEMCAAMDTMIRRHVPKWKVIDKKKSYLHRALSFIPPIVFFRKAYLNNFWTTIGYTAAHPAGNNNDWDTRPHEGLHALQAKRWTRPFFGFLYLFPQSFFLLIAVVLGVVLGSWWWLSLIVALLPWPAVFRMYWELEAYKISVMVEEWVWPQKAENDDGFINWIVDEAFKGPSYYFMWPFSKNVRKELILARQKARDWTQPEAGNDYLNDVYGVISDGGRLAEN